jgi:uncharacterized protein (TIGR02147 family)
MLETELTQTQTLSTPTASRETKRVNHSLVSPEVKPAEGTLVASPSVFDFRDYRPYLGQWLQWKKQENPQYSGAIFAKKAGLKAHSLLGMVIRGERNLSYEPIRGFTRALGLKGRETAFFEKLVLFNQARSSDDKRVYFEELLAAAQPTSSGQSGSAKAFDLLTQIKDHASYLSHWYVVAIREMVELGDFEEAPEWIAAKLKHRITAKQAKQALELLLKIGLIARETAPDGKARMAIRNPIIDIDPGGVDFVLQSYHKQYLDLAKEAIDHDPQEDRDTRDFSSLTLSVTEKDLERLRNRMQEFRKSLNVEFSAKEDMPTRTVAVNFQSLILTASAKSNKQSLNKK